MPAALPDSARFSLWFTAWAAGSVSLDAARDGILGEDTAHDVLGLPDRSEPVPLILALGLLRAEGAGGAVLALPEPGDPLGLAGPAAFNAEVLEAGEGVVALGAGLGLVPHRVGSAVQWRCLPAEEPRTLPDPGEADRDLRRALLEAAERLAALDVARWRPEVADELIALRSPADVAFPSGTGPRTAQMAATALRCRRIVALALADDGGSLVAAEAEARRAALQPLDRAARRGLVAACSGAHAR